MWPRLAALALHDQPRLRSCVGVSEARALRSAQDLSQPRAFAHLRSGDAGILLLDRAGLCGSGFGGRLGQGLNLRP